MQVLLPTGFASNSEVTELRLTGIFKITTREKKKKNHCALAVASFTVT
jgi:hypothetical protein